MTCWRCAGKGSRVATAANGLCRGYGSTVGWVDAGNFQAAAKCHVVATAAAAGEHGIEAAEHHGSALVHVIAAAIATGVLCACCQASQH